MPPELQLLVTLVGSGFMFHLTNSLFKSSLPGLGDVLKTNPDIMSNIMGAMGKAMNNAQGLTPGASSSASTARTTNDRKCHKCRKDLDKNLHKVPICQTLLDHL